MAGRVEKIWGVDFSPEISAVGMISRQVSGDAQERKALVSALRELLELVDMSELSCRDLDAHEFEAIADDATSRARKALKLFGDA